MIKTIICARCGNSFEGAHTAKYCLQCRIIVNRERTREWVREMRKEAYELERQEQAEVRKAQIEVSKKKYEKESAKREAKLQARADAGDPHARFEIESRKGNTHLEYWQAFQDKVETGGCVYAVNGLETTLPDFAELVVESIKAAHSIHITFIMMLDKKGD